MMTVIINTQLHHDTHISPPLPQTTPLRSILHLKPPILLNHLRTLLPDHKHRSLDINIWQQRDNTTINNPEGIHPIDSESRINYTTFSQRPHLIRARSMPIRDASRFDVFEDGIVIIR